VHKTFQVGYKEKLAVVLFASKAEAQACARDQDGKGLGVDFKVRTEMLTLHCLCSYLMSYDTAYRSCTRSSALFL
jgi:hypothetical protein